MEAAARRPPYKAVRSLGETLLTPFSATALQTYGYLGWRPPPGGLHTRPSDPVEIRGGFAAARVAGHAQAPWLPGPALSSLMLSPF